MRRRRPMCWGSSLPNVRWVTRRWSGLWMASQGCGLARSNGACRRCHQCSGSWLGATLIRIRCRRGCLLAGPVVEVLVVCHWFALPGRCLRSWLLKRLTPCWVRVGGFGIVQCARPLEISSRSDRDRRNKHHSGRGVGRLQPADTN
jgi:hypothetical protein